MYIYHSLSICQWKVIFKIYFLFLIVAENTKCIILIIFKCKVITVLILIKKMTLVILEMVGILSLLE